MDLTRRQTRVLAAGLIGAAVALLADVILPSDDVSSLEALLRVSVKTALALAAFLLASRVLAPVELAEASRSMRAIFLRRPRPPVS